MINNPNQIKLMIITLIKKLKKKRIMDQNIQIKTFYHYKRFVLLKGKLDKTKKLSSISQCNI
jgi:hypothetical protein